MSSEAGDAKCAVETMSYHEPRCAFRCLLWAVIAALAALLVSKAYGCDYAPDPATIPPVIVVMP